MDWMEDNTPTVSGWYVCEYCWEVQEGAFIGVFFFDTTWKRSPDGPDRDYPIFRCLGPYETEEEAEEIADKTEASF